MYIKNVTLLQKSVTIVLGCLKTNTTCKTGKIIVLGYLALQRPQLECNLKSAYKVSRNTWTIWGEWRGEQECPEHMAYKKRM